MRFSEPTKLVFFKAYNVPKPPLFLNGPIKTTKAPKGLLIIRAAGRVLRYSGFVQYVFRKLLRGLPPVASAKQLHIIFYCSRLPLRPLPREALVLGSVLLKYLIDCTKGRWNDGAKLRMCERAIERWGERAKER
jgi:hypothetical protein